MPTIACAASPDRILAVDSTSIRLYDAATLAQVGDPMPTASILGPSNDFAAAWDARSSHFIVAAAITGYGATIAALAPHSPALRSMAFLDYRSRGGTHYSYPTLGGDDRELALHINIDYGSNIQLETFWDRGSDMLDRLGRPSSYRHSRQHSAVTMSPVGEMHHIAGGFSVNTKRASAWVRHARLFGAIPWRTERYAICQHYPPTQPAAARRGDTLALARVVPGGVQVLRIGVADILRGGVLPTFEEGVLPFSSPASVAVALSLPSRLAILGRSVSHSTLVVGNVAERTFPTPHTAVCTLADGSFAVATPDGVTRR